MFVDYKNKTTKDMKMKKSKVIKVVGKTTYLESSYDENKTKRVFSAETRKKISDSRKKAIKQPREGQSKKANDFYKQLIKDYVKFSSARGKYQESKNEEYDHLLEMNDFIEQIEQEDKSEIELKEIKKRGKLTQKEKQIIKEWIEQEKAKLSLVTAKDGIISEYEIQKLNFTEIKMEESFLTNIEENSEELKSTLGVNTRKDIEIDDRLDEDLENKEYLELLTYLLENDSILNSFKEVFFKYSKEFLEKNNKKLDTNTKKRYNGYISKFIKFIDLNKLNHLILEQQSLSNVLEIFFLCFTARNQLTKSEYLTIITGLFEDRYFHYEYKNDLLDFLKQIA